MKCHIYRHQYIDELSKYHLQLTITPDHLQIDITPSTVQQSNEDSNDHPQNVFPPSTYTLALEELKSRQEWADGCCWILASSTGTVLPEKLINMSAESMSSREDRGIFSFLHGISSVLHIYVPYVDSTFEDMVFVLMASHDAIVESNIELVEEMTSRPDTIDLIPQLYLSVPDTIGVDETTFGTVYATYQNRAISKPLTVYLEHDNGYLPVKRLVLSSSEPHRFKISSLGLDPGDTIKVKAGFKYRKSLDTATITVK